MRFDPEEDAGGGRIGHPVGPLAMGIYSIWASARVRARAVDTMICAVAPLLAAVGVPARTYSSRTPCLVATIELPLQQALRIFFR